jgi:hypothetical protein
MAKYEDFGKFGDRSSVWHYFQRELAGQSAKCKQCSSILKTVGGSTKGFHTHLKAKHNTDLLKRTATQSSDASATTSSSCASGTSAAKHEHVFGNCVIVYV